MADRAALQRLMSAAADGDRAALDPLFHALWPPIVRYATRFLGGDASLAEDCAQDAIVKLFGQLARFDRERDALTWALAVTTWEVGPRGARPCDAPSRAPWHLKGRQHRRRAVRFDRRPGPAPGRQHRFDRRRARRGATRSDPRGARCVGRARPARPRRDRRVARRRPRAPPRARTRDVPQTTRARTRPAPHILEVSPWHALISPSNTHAPRTNVRTSSMRSAESRSQESSRSRRSHCIARRA